MKVKELIEELKKLDGEKTIGYYNPLFEDDCFIAICETKTDNLVFSAQKEPLEYDYVIC